MTFLLVFILAFHDTDYVITGTVTNTWIGIAVIMAVIVGLIRWSFYQLRLG